VVLPWEILSFNGNLAGVSSCDGGLYIVLITFIFWGASVDGCLCSLGKLPFLCDESGLLALGNLEILIVCSDFSMSSCARELTATWCLLSVFKRTVSGLASWEQPCSYPHRSRPTATSMLPSASGLTIAQLLAATPPPTQS